MSKTLRWLLFFLGMLVSPAFGQVPGPPFVFSADTVIDPDEMNLNFTTIYDAACNRGGCTMTGTFSGINGTFSGTLGVTGATTLGSTLGVTGATTLAALSATTGTFSSTLGVTGAATLSSTLGVTGATTLSSTLGVSGASTLAALSATTGTFSGGITAGGSSSVTGNFRITGSYMRPDNAGAAMTLGNGTNNLFDTQLILSGLGVFLAQIDANGMLLRNASAFTAQNTAVATVNLATVTGANTPFFGPTDAQAGAGCCTATVLNGPAVVLRTNSVDRTTVGNDGTLTHTAAFALTGTISPAALPSGTTHNYNPAGLATAFMLLVPPDAGGSTLTGIAAQSGGSFKVLCAAVTGGGGNLSLTALSGSSPPNRFATAHTLTPGQCKNLWYDTTVPIWRVW